MNMGGTTGRSERWKYGGIPTGTGTATATASRSAADPSNFSDFLLLQIPYPSISSISDPHTLRPLLTSATHFGAFLITAHGIPTSPLRLALDDCHTIFSLTTTYAYAHHQKLVWCADDRQITDEAISLIGRQNFHLFRQKLESVAGQLEAIAQELGKAIAESGFIKPDGRPIPLGEPTLSIYRYHPINSSTAMGIKRRQESGPCALTLYLLLDPTEFCVEQGQRRTEFAATPDTLIVTIGKDVEEWSGGELKSAHGKPMFKQAKTSAFLIEHRWSSAFNFRKVVIGKPVRIISVVNQVMVILIASLVYKFIAHVYF